MGENMEKEQWMKESLQMQKASWIQDEITKRREREDELLQQIFMEQKMLQELDEDMDENMAHAREGRKYREDMKERVNDRVCGNINMHTAEATPLPCFSFHWHCASL